MKLRIFFVSVVLPILLAAAIFVVFYHNDNSYRIFMPVILSIAIAARIFFSDRKYILKFNFTTTHLEIDYSTSLLLTRSARIALAKVMDMELTRMNWVVEYPAALNIKVQGKWWEYQILQRSLLKAIEAELSARDLITLSKNSSQQSLP